MGGAGVVTLPWVGAGTWILVLVVASAVAATAGAQWSRVAIEDHTALPVLGRVWSWPVDPRSHGGWRTASTSAARRTGAPNLTALPLTL